MRLPLGWLGQHVNLSTMDPLALSERLTIGGVEVESDESIGLLSPLAVVGVVLSREADARPGLCWLTVDVGRAEPVLVATRSANLQAAAVGTRIAVALPGAALFAPKEGGLLGMLTVAAREMFGRPSGGVGCSAFELGAGEDHSGVLILDGQLAAGTPLSKVLSAMAGAERVLTVAILPNIARCQSILGSAREVGALAMMETALEVEEAPVVVGSSAQDPQVDDTTLCGRFATALIDGIVVGPSPLWMQRRLLACGQQPRNNVVDVSNYVMLELGQPTHAYDADTLPSLVLGVRRARAGELFKPLVADEDDAPTALPEGIPVITCDDNAVAMAGVMGGFETRVTDATTRLLLESANFDYIAIRRSQAATLTYTEASARFSRGVDPSLVERAIRRSVALLRETCPDIRVVSTGLHSAVSLDDRKLSLTVQQLNGALGTSLDAEQVAAQLGRVGLSVAADGDALVVSVPSSRPDITIPSDLYEEVARLHGYDRLPATMPLEPVPTHLPDPGIRIRAEIEDVLVAAGLQQTISYTLSSPELEAKLRAGSASAPVPAYATLTNPNSEDRRVFRRTLLAHLVACTAENLRHTSGFHAFELGVVARPEGGVDGLPVERRQLALVQCGLDTEPSMFHTQPRSVDAHDLVGVVRDLLAHLHIADVQWVANRDRVGFHPGICADVLVGGEVLGTVGALHPAAAAAFDLAGRKVFVAELDADALVAKVPERFLAPTPPRHPGVRLDISVIVDDSVSAGALEQTLREAASGLLRDVAVFDVYRGTPIPAGRKAVGFRFELGAAERTLAMSEAEAARETIVAALARVYGAELRA